MFLNKKTNNKPKRKNKNKKKIMSMMKKYSKPKTNIS